MHGADGLIHAAGSYRVGIPAAERPAMWDANVGTTKRVLDAAMRPASPRIVYVSTVNVFGNTHGRIVDETYRRDLAEGFLSWYDETKYRAHEAAEQRIAAGAPIVIVLPGRSTAPATTRARRSSSRPPTTARPRIIAFGDRGIGAGPRRRPRRGHRRRPRPRPDRRGVHPRRPGIRSARRCGIAARPAAAVRRGSSSRTSSCVGSRLAPIGGASSASSRTCASS